MEWLMLQNGYNAHVITYYQYITEQETKAYLNLLFSDVYNGELPF